MINISVNTNGLINYITNLNTNVTGSLFIDKKRVQGTQLSDYVSKWSWDTKDLINNLKNSNGFFSLIRYENGKLFAAVDRCRSMPLFYGFKDNDFFISDSPQWIRKKVQNNQIDKISKEALLLSGYVTEGNTLYQNVKQIQAGEMLYVINDQSQLKIELHRYFPHYINPLLLKKREILAELDKVLIDACTRLINFAHGKTIVIPLSAGYDSRLILLMLKRLGYNNLLTFTYGRPGNKESIISQEIACKMQVPWEFVPYSNNKWRKWSDSVEWDQWWNKAHGYVSLPHIQDWPALWELKKKNKLAEECIIVPGHTVTLSTSGRPLITTISGIASSIYKKHFCTNHTATKIQDKFNIEKQLQNYIDLGVQEDQLFEMWELMERQSKFIVNSVRSYEYWGFQWWLPLWDAELLKFWLSIPLEYRQGKSIYIEYVSQLYSHLANIPLQEAIKTERSGHRTLIKEKIKNSKLRSIAYYLYYAANRRLEYNNHPFAWYGIFPKNKFSNIYSGKENINTLLRKELINRLEHEDYND